MAPVVAQGVAVGAAAAWAVRQLASRHWLSEADIDARGAGDSTGNGGGGNGRTSTALKQEALLRDRFAVVTGGSEGIGFETVRLLAQRGAIVAVGSRDPYKAANAKLLLLSRLAASVHPATRDIEIADENVFVHDDFDVCAAIERRTSSGASTGKSRSSKGHGERKKEDLVRCVDGPGPVWDRVIGRILHASSLGPSSRELARALLEEHAREVLRDLSLDQAEHDDLSQSYRALLQCCRERASTMLRSGKKDEVKLSPEYQAELEIALARLLYARLASPATRDMLERRVLFFTLDLADLQSIKRFGKQVKTAFLHMVKLEALQVNTRTTITGKKMLRRMKSSRNEKDPSNKAAGGGGGVELARQNSNRDEKDRERAFRGFHADPTEHQKFVVRCQERVKRSFHCLVCNAGVVPSSSSSSCEQTNYMTMKVLSSTGSSTEQASSSTSSASGGPAKSSTGTANAFSASSPSSTVLNVNKKKSNPATTTREPCFDVNCLGHHHLINKLAKGDDGHSYSLFGRSLKASHFPPPSAETPMVAAPTMRDHIEEERGQEPPILPVDHDHKDDKRSSSQQATSKGSRSTVVASKPRIIFVSSSLLSRGSLSGELSQRLGDAESGKQDPASSASPSPGEVATAGDESSAKVLQEVSASSSSSSKETSSASRCPLGKANQDGNSSAYNADSKLVNALQSRAYAGVFGNVVDSFAVCPGWCYTRLGSGSRTSMTEMLTRPVSTLLAGLLCLRSANDGAANVVHAVLVDPGSISNGAVLRDGVAPIALNDKVENEIEPFFSGTEYLRTSFLARFMRSLDQIVEAKKR
ncbi:unnamed protein product [Amoebophrya sp. A25]|nr:unnamed protein product [Amoebophrya sp. A25]|eukprot:GSA25T00013046001.1